MDPGLGLFYYTLIVLLAVILTAATCLASYLVTRNKTYRYAFAGFLFYFFDVALVFQDDFLMQRASDASASPFFIGSPVASVLVGGGALISFWLVLLENVVFLLVVDPHAIAGQRLPFFPERNFAENALVLCCGFAACTSAWRSLSLRRTEPPTQGGASLETFIDQNLAAYAAARQLSKREAEVLRLVLLGKDNQNIATSMHLAPSTVKVHMHHILQKAERANRKELIQDFWEFS